jgi:ABC-type transporter Mla subunit MlaD
MIGRVARTIVIFASLPLLGCRSDVFRFQIVFSEAPALKEGCQVRYLGLEVGRVEEITLNRSPNGGSPEVSVAVALKEKNIPIRRDDKFTIATAGLLGEAFVDIRPGPSNSPAIPSGSTVRGEILAFSPETISSYQSAIGIAARLDALPVEKREKLTKTFNELIDAALEEERRLPAQGRESAEPKR